MSVSLQTFIELNPQEDAVLLLGQLATAYPLGLRRREALRLVDERCGAAVSTGVDGFAFVDSLEEGGHAWRRTFETAVGQLSGVGRAGLIAIELSTNSPVLGPDELTSSVSLRRLDALLDTMGVEFSAADAQGAVVATLAELDPAWASRFSDETLVRMKGAAEATATALTMFHPLLGGAAQVGVGLLAGGQDAAGGDQAPTLIDGADCIARAIACCRFVLEPEEAKEVASKARGILTAELSGATADLNRQAQRARMGSGPSVSGSLKQAERRHRMLIAALDLFLEVDPEPSTTVDTPDLVGMRLSDARRTLAAFGIEATAVDGLRPNGASRAIWSEGNWRVAHHELSPAGDHVLSVLKFGESFPERV
jgi:hypothetical protein